MATSAAALVIVWAAGLVFLLGGRWLSITAPWSGAEKRCRVHRWTRTEKGFLCSVCGWRCESGVAPEGDVPPVP
jgi:hypothetical protein